MRRLSSRSVRLLRAMGLAALIALFVAGPVSAKMPYFTVDIAPAAPRAGEPISVVVRTWVDVQHTIPAGVTAVDGMVGLLVIRTAGGGSPDIPVPLHLGAPDRFEGTVTLPAGDWTLVTFPDRTGWATSEVPAGYPDRVAIPVRGPGPTVPEVVVFAVAIAALSLAVASVLRRRRSNRLSAPQRPSEAHNQIV